PILKFGVITDIQHAPIPDGKSFSGSPRFYSNALTSTSTISSIFEKEECEFALNLGDIIDGKVKEQSALTHLEVLDNVLAGMNNFTKPWHHVYGNHELYTDIARPILQNKLNIPFVQKTEVGDYKFIFLDSYDETVLGRTGSKKAAAEVYLNKNPNYLKGEINSPVGMLDDEVRFVAFNGGYGEAQMEWLKGELERSRDLGERVIISGHQPFHPSTTNLLCLTLNYKPMLTLLQSYSSTIIATFSGHTHWPGYVEDRGIHHVVFSAVLESEPGVDSYGIVKVFEDRLVIEG
ncbi:hypothetical protein TL16_g12267, partial [Triparma laevis f. inornata]